MRRAVGARHLANSPNHAIIEAFNKILPNTWSPGRTPNLLKPPRGSYLLARTYVRYLPLIEHTFVSKPKGTVNKKAANIRSNKIPRGKKKGGKKLQGKRKEKRREKRKSIIGAASRQREEEKRRTYVR